MKHLFEFKSENKPSSPAGGVEAKQPVPPSPTPVAHAGASAAFLPPPASTKVYVTTFAIRNPTTGNIVSDVVEVPCTGISATDKAAAWTAVKLRHPKTLPKDIRRAATRIVTRPGGENPVVPIREGETIRQIFPDKTEFETARTVGTIIFDGVLCDVILRHLRAKAAFSVVLRQSGGTVVTFSEQVTTTRLVDDLPKILREILGAPAETLKLYLKKA